LTLYKTLLRLTDSLLLFFAPGVLIVESNVWPIRSGRKTKIPEEEEVKSNKLNLLTAAFAVALLVTGAAAQEGPHGGPHGGPGGPGMELRGLDLTDAQKAQVKQIMTAERPTLKPLMQQEMQNHQQMTALVRGGSFEEAKAQPIAAQEAQIHSQIAVERAKMDAQIYQLLTPEQKTKLTEREAKRGQWMQQREEAGPPPAEPNQ
jgi:periplasmic protein CpxP/Spy